MILPSGISGHDTGSLDEREPYKVDDNKTWNSANEHLFNLFLFHLVIVSLSSCVFISLFVAFVVLALIFLPGLYSTAFRADFLA